MSSVTPSEGYNSYPMKRLTELEDELKRDHARSEKRSKERVDDIERSFTRATEQNEEKTTEAVDHIREDAEKNALRTTENHRNELEKLKKQNYDRFGRNRNNEADISKQQLTDTIESARIQHEQDTRRLKDSESSHEKSVDKLTKDYNARMDHAVKQAHDSADEAFHNAFEGDQSALESQRREDKARFEDLNQERLAEQAHQRRLTEKVIADNERDMTTQKKQIESSLEERLHKQADASRKAIEDATGRQSKVHAEESHALRNKIDDLVSAESHYVKEVGQGKADAVREYNDEWRARERTHSEAHQKEVRKLKEQADLSDSYSSQINDRNLHERDAYFTSLLAKKAGENREEQKTLAQRYDKNHTQLETRLKMDRRHSTELLENEMRGAAENKREALENQALGYQKTIENQRQLNKEETEALERQLNSKTTPTEGEEISPVVENMVRRSIVKQYEKNLNAESDRNKRTVDTVQRSYSDRLQTAEMEHGRASMKREQENQAERHQETVRFNEHISDTEFQKDEALRNGELDHQRQTDVMQRAFTYSTNRQRNDYEQMLQTVKDDASSRITAIRQEADFNSKSAHRAFSAKQNELIRDYEKKLTEQKQEFDSRVDTIKTEAAQTQRENERRTKNTLEEQTRSYEQRLAQLQSQQQERERMISQNYQDEMEKVKRSNALQQSKKS